MPRSLIISENLQPSQVRMARVGLDLTVRELAVLCEVNKATIVRIEAGYPVRDSTMKVVRGILEEKGAKFTACNESNFAYVGVNVI